MSPANTIREQLAQYIEENEMTFSRFADFAGINSGTLSRILQGSRPISMSQLICITKGMGLPEDHFFEDYVQECFTYTVSLRRIRPFLMRCAELERLDCMEQVVSLLLDDLLHIAELFELAEYCYHNNLYPAALLLYQQVSEAEKLQHSERLALCHYRLFRLSIGDDLEKNIRAATLFEPYVRRLDEVDQLDAFKHLIHVFWSVNKFSKVDELAQKMLELAKIQYQLKFNSTGRDSEQKLGERPLYFYILYALLVRSNVFEEYGDYEKALEFVELYANGKSWVREQDEQSRRTLQQFEEWAEANTFLYRLLSGDTQILPTYVEYITRHEDEIFTGIRYIVQAANKFNLDIDEILDRFSAHLSLRTYKTEFGEYDQAIMNENYAQFLTNLGIYHLTKDRNDAINYILEGLQISIKIKSDRNIISCMTLFEQYRERADSDAVQKFKSLSSEVQRLNEKKMEYASSPM